MLVPWKLAMTDVPDHDKTGGEGIGKIDSSRILNIRVICGNCYRSISIR